jgi:hypothetical protein
MNWKFQSVLVSLGDYINMPLSKLGVFIVAGNLIKILVRKQLLKGEIYN